MDYRMSKVRLYGNTSGYVDLAAPDVAGDVTITLPNATGPFALESYVDAAVAAIPGIGSNVVQTVKTDTFSASIAQGAESGDVTGLTVSITPTSTNSKVLVIANIAAAATSSSESAGITLYRDGTRVAAGAADGSRRQIAGGAINQTNLEASVVPITFLDSPGTASAVVYSVRLSHTTAATATIYVNRSGGDTNSNRAGRSASTITAIEVKA
jgi:hypothetical protein